MLRHAITRLQTRLMRAGARRFAVAAADPAAAQRSLILRLLRDNAQSAYGRETGYARIASVSAFQDRVPVVDHDAIAPWIDRIARGEVHVLTRAPVLALERSGGSTRGTTKRFPITRPFIEEVSAATAPWLFDLYANDPALHGTRTYWSISPVAQAQARTSGGVPIGIEDDAEYFGPLVAWALRRQQAVPADVARATDADAWRERTARHLLDCADLGLLSVWSPTFLTNLMRYMDANLDKLLAQVRPSRANGIRRALARAEHGLTGDALWPRLRLVSCWTDGSSRAFVPALRAYFPRTPIQGKGLLATEGVVSFPLTRASAPVAAVAGHFLEFIDLDNASARPKLLHQLRAGGRYSPLLTTGAGLTRYHLKDVVACTGHHGGAPLLRFEGRLDHVSDLCGEKLSPGQVERALEAACEKTGLAPDFALLAPVTADPPHYTLYVEAHASNEEIRAFASVVEARLEDAHAYRYCRQLRQLGPLRASRATDAWARYERALLARGQRLGALKPSALDARAIWDEALDARSVDA